ncbi:phosphotransferase family protein [Streptomyces sp. NPDC058000]|uniref:phosphotransferase family protein n=1 Tax=Streptomyces sp. NPDC058000 TaxID=3346299 RepID=UPI0036E0FC34
MDRRMDAMALYEEACRRDDGHAGYYNHNVRVTSGHTPVMVRIPTAGAESMDLAVWPEPELLEAIRPYVGAAPQLLHAQAEPPFQIHEFIAGRSLDEVCPAGTALPGRVLDDIGELFGQLLRVPSGKLPAAPAGWPGDGDCAGFAAALLALVRTIRAAGDPPTQRLYTELGVPHDPCALLERQAGELHRRPFRLLHADLHRGNMITDGRRTVFLDWELALWGDPVYDLADHLHKMSYLPREDARVRNLWRQAAPADCRTDWVDGLGFYLGYERMKSAVVDTVRWARRIAVADSAATRRSLAGALAAKYAAARPHWEPVAAVPTLDAVERAAVRWARATGQVTTATPPGGSGGTF